MSIVLLLVLLAIGGAMYASRNNNRQQQQMQESSLDDARADARRWIERLGSQVLTISGTDAASTQAMADASERFTAANSQISQATTVAQAKMARESALEGLHYVNAAREIMGLPAGPELPLLEGQRRAGAVTETRTINHEGQTITASPHASEETPNYYPGGMVAGRPVPAGWYSRPWWADALHSGMWTMGSVMLFSSLFSGMSGVNYSAQAFENGYGDGYADGLAAAENDFDADGFDGDGFDGGFDGGFDDAGGGLFDGGFDFDF